MNDLKVYRQNQTTALCVLITFLNPNLILRLYIRLRIGTIKMFQNIHFFRFWKILQLTNKCYVVL